MNKASVEQESGESFREYAMGQAIAA